MAGNDLLIGWKRIAEFLGVSERSIRSYKSVLLEQRKIFYRRRRLGTKSVCAWEDDLRQWTKERHS